MVKMGTEVGKQRLASPASNAIPQVTQASSAYSSMHIIQSKPKG
jgi:hypothetical protein